MTKPASSPSATGGSFFGSFWMLLAALGFTSMGILAKITAQKFDFHEYELTFWRMSFATVVLGTHALISQKSLSAFTTDYPKAHFWRSVVGGVSVLLLFYGITHLPLATAITFNYTSAIFLAVWSVILLKQNPKPLTWFALFLGFIGIMFLLKPTLLNNGILTTLLGLTSGIGAGYAYLQVRELSLLGEPSWKIVFYFSLVTALFSGILSLYHGFSPVRMEVLPYVLGVGFAAMVGQLAMTHAYKVGRKFMVASLSYFTVVMSTIYGAFVFGEMLDFWAMFGILLIISSGILSGIKS